MAAIRIHIYSGGAPRAALQPLAADAFPYFASGERTVHTDGHVEVGGAFYPVPLALLARRSASAGTCTWSASSPTTPVEFATLTWVD